MANLTADQLMEEVKMVNQTREEFYSYLRMHHPAITAIADDYTARNFFERNIIGNRAELHIQSRVWLPEYNRTHRRPRLNPNPPATGNGSTSLERGLTKAAIVGATGLVGLLAGLSMDEGAAKNLVQTVSGTAFTGALVGAGIVYVRQYLSR